MNSESSAIEKKPIENESQRMNQAIGWKDKKFWALIMVIFLVCVGVGVGVGVGVTRDQKYAGRLHFS